MIHRKLPKMAALAAFVSLAVAPLAAYAQTAGATPSPSPSPTPKTSRRHKAKADATPAASSTAPAEPAASATAGTAVPGKLTKYPFHGKIASIDTTANTVTLGGKTPRTLMITPETKITKNGAPAKLTDGVAGDETGGRIEKGADGKLTALSLRFGPKVPKSGATAPASPAPSPKP